MRMHSVRLLRLIAILIVVALICAFAFNRIVRYIYPMQYDTLVNEMAGEYELAPSLVFAVIHTESQFDKNAVSSANAKGLMQLTDDTFHWALRRAGQEEISAENLYIPSINIRYGCYVLVLLSEQFGDIETVLAAYNAGQGRVREWLKNPQHSDDGVTLKNIPYEETASYVRRVLTAQKRYQQIYNIQ